MGAECTARMALRPSTPGSSNVLVYSETVSNGLEKVRADLLKWSFVFWVGSVTAIAALAGVLR